MAQHRYSALLLVVAIGLGKAGSALGATDFAPVDGAEEQLQSRRYTDTESMVLLQASLAVLQDIRFQIVESELDPALLVAQTFWRQCGCNMTLTVSVLTHGDRPGDYQVRLTASIPPQPVLVQMLVPTDFTNFYQDFFKHLDRELFKERES